MPEAEEPDDQLDDVLELEEHLEEEDTNNHVPPVDIVAYNELRSCADIVRMYNNDQLTIQPDFQREVVWTNPARTRFLDSLIKQLPIPSMCISLDYKTQNRLVIDGLQRISTIIKFLTDDDWKLSPLDDIDPKISGKEVGEIRKEFGDIYGRVENVSIPITVLRCSYAKKTHMQYLFTIFHRLNSGGNKLTNQEIRNCIFSGSFNKLLKDLVIYPNFRALLSLKEGKHYRYAYEELILRFFTMTMKYESYTGNLAKFLNSFMDDNQNASDDKLKAWEDSFKQNIDMLYDRILESRPLPKLSKATIEALYVAIARNYEHLVAQSKANLQGKYWAVRRDELFSAESLKEGLSKKERVKDRLNQAVAIFGE